MSRIMLRPHNDKAIEIVSTTQHRTLGLLVKDTVNRPNEWVFAPAVYERFTISTLREILSEAEALVKKEYDAACKVRWAQEIEDLQNAIDGNPHRSSKDDTDD